MQLEQLVYYKRIIVFTIYFQGHCLLCTKNQFNKTNKVCKCFLLNLLIRCDLIRVFWEYIKNGVLSTETDSNWSKDDCSNTVCNSLQSKIFLLLLHSIKVVISLQCSANATKSWLLLITHKLKKFWLLENEKNWFTAPVLNYQIRQRHLYPPSDLKCSKLFQRFCWDHTISTNTEKTFNLSRSRQTRTSTSQQTSAISTVP